MYFFTEYFAIDASFYRGKSILDLGCGPRGSLEWATGAKRRVGLDPLARQYRRLSGSKHQMEYVTGHCEKIPYANESFDVVSSFNSLDHVDDLENCIGEIIRILKPGGLLFIIVDIHDDATVTEPSPVTWDLPERFKPGLELLSARHYEGHQMYKSIREGLPFDHNDNRKRYGVLTAKLRKNQ